MSLIGSLDEVRIADVLRLFAAGRKTGRLTVSAEEEQAVLHFQKGAIVHAHAAGGSVQGDEAVVELFGWKEGQLTFVPEETAVPSNVSRGVDQLILEGLRSGDHAHRMRMAIPSDEAVFQTADGPADAEARIEVSAGEWRILRLVDGSRDVGELVAQSGAERGTAVEALFRLLEAGFLEAAPVQQILNVHALPREAPAELDQKLDAEWRRLRRFERGVKGIVVRRDGRAPAFAPVVFRPELGRRLHLPRPLFAELGLHEGDEVRVRPGA
jgi:hypothetical protein